MTLISQARENRSRRYVKRVIVDRMLSNHHMETPVLVYTSEKTKSFFHVPSNQKKKKSHKNKHATRKSFNNNNTKPILTILEKKTCPCLSSRENSKRLPISWLLKKPKMGNWYWSYILPDCRIETTLNSKWNVDLLKREGWKSAHTKTNEKNMKEKKKEKKETASDRSRSTCRFLMEFPSRRTSWWYSY